MIIIMCFDKIRGLVWGGSGGWIMEGMITVHQNQLNLHGVTMINLFYYRFFEKYIFGI